MMAPPEIGFRLSRLNVEITNIDSFRTRTKMMTNLLSRRTVLKGLGASVALPWLEAMGPLSAWATQPQAGNRVPTRMAFVYVPNGKNMAEWTPRAAGTDFTLPSTLEP